MVMLFSARYKIVRPNQNFFVIFTRIESGCYRKAGIATETRTGKVKGLFISASPKYTEIYGTVFSSLSHRVLSKIWKIIMSANDHRWEWIDKVFVNLVYTWKFLLPITYLSFLFWHKQTFLSNLLSKYY